MGKATIIEAQNSNTVYEEGTANKGILGKLKGIFADYKNGTRNADRLYTEELWDNRVFGSEDVMEALETKTLFGELDHPDGDRCETLAKNAAISITKLEKRPDEGVIYGEAEILDTPTGRIVKALADSGAKLGISSRGMGEEIYVDGQNIIDPETYDFITFDVVVTPANTKARVSLTESKQLDKLTESLHKEVNECETENQINQLKTVIENVNVSDKDKMINTLNEKLDKLAAKNNVQLTEANREVALNLIKQKYEECKAQLNEAIAASENLANENKQLIDKNTFLEESRTMLKSKLKENKEVVIDQQANTITELETKLGEANTTITSLQEELDRANAKNKETLLKQKQINESKLNNVEEQYKAQITELTEANTKSETKFNNLLAENKKLMNTLTAERNAINEHKSIISELNNKIQLLESEKVTNTKKLTERKLQEATKIRSLEDRIASLEKEKKSLEESQTRLSELAFNPVGTVKAVPENFNTGEYSQEDIDLVNAIAGK